MILLAVGRAALKFASVMSKVFGRRAGSCWVVADCMTCARCTGLSRPACESSTRAGSCRVTFAREALRHGLRERKRVPSRSGMLRRITLERGPY